jgi:hypothetical protein
VKLRLPKKELFLKRVFEIASELKMPVVDEKVYDSATIDEARPMTSVTFAFDKDESIIRGFLSLAQYYHTIVIKKGERFFIPVSDMLLKLESK